MDLCKFPGMFPNLLHTVVKLQPEIQEKQHKSSYRNKREQLDSEQLLKNRGSFFLLVQSDAPSVSAPREFNYTDVEDTLEGMIIRAEYRHFNFPYLYDGDTQEFVDKLGPKATPHVFVFGQARKLQYEGRIDDNMTETRVKTHDLRNALDALLADRRGMALGRKHS